MELKYGKDLYDVEIGLGLYNLLNDEVLMKKNKKAFKGMCLEAMKNGASLNYVPLSYRDSEVCIEAIKRNNCKLEDIPLESRNKELWLSWLDSDLGAITDLDKIEDTLIDEEISLAAIKKYGSSVLNIFVPDKLKNKEFYLKAIKAGMPLGEFHLYNNLSVDEMVKIANERLKMISKGKEVPPLSTVFGESELVFNIPKEYINEEVCIAFSSNKRFKEFLPHLPERVKTYKVYLSAVKNGMSINEIPSKLVDSNVIIAALDNASKDDLKDIIKYIPETRSYIKVYAKALEKGLKLNEVPMKLRSVEICNKAIELVSEKDLREVLSCVPVSKKYTEVYLKALEKGLKLNEVPMKLRNEEICNKAIELASKEGLGEVLNYLPMKFKTKELCEKACKQDPMNLEFVPSKFKDRELCLECVQANVNAIKFIPNKYKNMKFYKNAIDLNINVVRHIPETLLTDEFLVSLSKQLVSNKDINTTDDLMELNDIAIVINDNKNKEIENNKHMKELLESLKEKFNKYNKSVNDITSMILENMTKANENRSFDLDESKYNFNETKELLDLKNMIIKRNELKQEQDRIIDKIKEIIANSDDSDKFNQLKSSVNEITSISDIESLLEQTNETRKEVRKSYKLAKNLKNLLKKLEANKKELHNHERDLYNKANLLRENENIRYENMLSLSMDLKKSKGEIGFYSLKNITDNMIDHKRGSKDNLEALSDIKKFAFEYNKDKNTTIDNLVRLRNKINILRKKELKCR